MSFAAIAIGTAVAVGGTAYMASRTPDAPDYAAANREGIMTDIETLPLRKLIERAAKLGLKATYKDPRTGKDVTSDFSGIGDIDFARANLKFSEESSDKMAQVMLGLQEKYGSQFIAQRLKELEQSDPTGFALRQKLGKTVSEDLDRGYKLAPGMAAEVEQSERAAQAARGNILGPSSGAAEAMQTGNAAFRMYQQRLANAASFLSGTTPVAQFGQIAGAQQGAAPMMGAGIQQGIGQNPNAGAMGYNAAQWGYQQNIANDPWRRLGSSVQTMGIGGMGQGFDQLLANVMKTN